MAEDLPRPCAVDPRGLERLGRHHLERGEQHEQREGEPLPDIRRDDRGQREARIGQPGRLGQPHEAQSPVQHADVRSEENLPDDGHYDGRQHHRDDEEGADGLENARAPVQKESRAQAEQELPQDREYGQPELHAQRVAKPAITGKLGEVGEGAAEVPPGGGPGQVERRETGQEKEGKGRQRHDGQHHEGGRQQGHVDALAPPHGRAGAVA
jgi:hypothetical protein